MIRKRIFCDNCGRFHLGVMSDWGAWDTGPEWDFEWVDTEGNPKVCADCGNRRDPCTPRDCWYCCNRRAVPLEAKEMGLSK